MGLSLVQRLGLKYAWGRIMKKNAFRRWVPLLGTIVLIALAILRATGNNEAAQAIEAFATLFGLQAGSAVPAAEVTAAVVAGTGVVLKVVSEIRKAKAERSAIKLLLFALLPLASGCGTLKGQVQIGSDVSHPNSKVLQSHVCRGDESAARLYLALPEYAWLGAGALERWFTDAKDFEHQGRCPCKGDSCPGGK